MTRSDHQRQEGDDVALTLDWVATVPPTVKLAAEKFGAERAPMVFGWLFMGHQIGAAAAAFFAGALRTGLDTYMPALFTAGVLCIVAALSVLAIGRKPTDTANAPALA